MVERTGRSNERKTTPGWVLLFWFSAFMAISALAGFFEAGARGRVVPPVFVILFGASLVIAGSTGFLVYRRSKTTFGVALIGVGLALSLVGAEMFMQGGDLLPAEFRVRFRWGTLLPGVLSVIIGILMCREPIRRAVHKRDLIHYGMAYTRQKLEPVRNTVEEYSWEWSIKEMLKKSLTGAESEDDVKAMIDTHLREQMKSYKSDPVAQNVMPTTGGEREDSQ